MFEALMDIMGALAILGAIILLSEEYLRKYKIVYNSLIFVFSLGCASVGGYFLYIILR